MLQTAGNPQLKYHAVHVAGTNGKGSVVAFVGSVLGKAGFKVGRYTSPHLVDFSERIVVDDIPVSDADLDRLILRFAPVAEEMAQIEGLERPTYFEFGTALAFQHFCNENVDFAVIETGLGGRLDSTNVLEPEVVAITNTEIDHTHYLGSSIPKIAFEKAGIIRGSAPVVTATRYSEALEVIRDKCSATDARLYVHGEDFNYTIEPIEFPRQRMSFSSAFGELHDLVIPLAGAYQGENAALSAMICFILRERYPQITDECIRDGLVATNWPCRLDLLRQEPPTIVDGGHNPSAAARVREEVERAFPGREIILILAVSGDKDAAGIASVLSPLAAKVIVTTYGLTRAMPAEKLYEIACRFSDNCVMEPNLEAAVATADSSAGSDSLVLIAGSLYIGGEAVQLFSSGTSGAAF